MIAKQLDHPNKVVGAGADMIYRSCAGNILTTLAFDADDHQPKGKVFILFCAKFFSFWKFYLIPLKT